MRQSVDMKKKNIQNIALPSVIYINKKDASSLMTNISVLRDTSIRRIEYKTLRGFIKILKQQNKTLKKHNIKAKFEITLPVPD